MHKLIIIIGKIFSTSNDHFNIKNNTKVFIENRRLNSCWAGNAFELIGCNYDTI